jgi:hypothetical protein
MTVLIGASVLLIAGSAVALVFGWTGADQSLIWTSIAATAAAAVALSLAYFRSRSAPAPARASGGSIATEPAEAAAVPEETGASEPPPEDQVVAIASTKKFHRPDCRYASSASGTKMSAAEARKQSYAPCGICKP